MRLPRRAEDGLTVSFPGAYGYVAPFAPTPFRTLMAYHGLCTDLDIVCVAAPRFSDPSSLTADGWPYGTIGEQLTDNRSVIELTKRTVANYRHRSLAY